MTLHITEHINYFLYYFNLNWKRIILLCTILLSLFDLNLCQQSTSTLPPDTQMNPTTPNTKKPNSKNRPNFTAIYIVLIIVFAVLVLLVLLCIFYQYHRRGKLDDDYDDSNKKEKDSSTNKNRKNNSSDNSTNKKNGRTNDIEGSRSKSKSKSKSKSDKKKSKNKNKKSRNGDSDDVAIDTGGMYETDESGDDIPNQIRFRNSVSSVPDNGNTNAKMQLSVTTPRGTTIAADQYSDYQVKRDTLEDNMMDDVNEEPDDQDEQEPAV